MGGGRGNVIWVLQATSFPPCFYAEGPESVQHYRNETSVIPFNYPLVLWEVEIHAAHSNFLLLFAVYTQWSSQEPAVVWCSAPPGSKFQRQEVCDCSAAPATAGGLISLT